MNLSIVGGIALAGLSIAAFGAETPDAVPSSSTAALNAHSGSKVWENSLGQRFVPVPGTSVLFSVWDTRVKDFAAFVSSTGYDATADVMSMTLEGGKKIGANWKAPGFEQGPTHPVVAVSWVDAKAFCAWLTSKERLEGRIDSHQRYRLPTDTEWSLAAGLREPKEGAPAGKSEKIKDVYPWGATWPPPNGVANYAGEEARAGIWPRDWGVLAGYRDDFPRTSPVGSFPANTNGLYDMGGNVWQWCEDDFTPASHLPVLRGASFLNHFPNELLLSYRFHGSSAESRSIYLGFRCVLETP